MTKEQIENLRDKPHWRPSWIQPREWKELCDLALQSISQESVRSEARNAVLEEAARECGICASRQAAKHDQKVRDQTRRDLASAIRALQSTARVAEGRSSDPEFEHEPPETQGTWQERCAALYQVVGCMAHMFGIFETSDDVSDALDVAAGRGDVEKLLPWPKVDLRTLVKAPESPAKEQPGEQNAAPQQIMEQDVGSPAPAAVAAPDVASMVKRLRAVSANSLLCQEAAALIEKLGQGGFTPDPTVELMVNELCKPDSKETKY